MSETASEDGLRQSITGKQNELKKLTSSEGFQKTEVAELARQLKDLKEEFKSRFGIDFKTVRPSPPPKKKKVKDGTGGGQAVRPVVSTTTTRRPSPPPEDRNFDDLAERFVGQIYGTAKGRLRLDMVTEDLMTHLPELFDPTAPRLVIVDAGGGIGQLSADLAAQGHRIVLCDISSAMLDKAREHFASNAPGADVTLLHCGIKDLPRLLAELPGRPRPHLILFHAVVEWLRDAQAALLVLDRLLRPNGHLSVLFYNRHALVWRYLMNGSLEKAHGTAVKGSHTGSITHGNKRKRSNPLLPPNPQYPETVIKWLSELNVQVVVWKGIRALHDHMPDSVRERTPYPDLLAAEQRFGRHPPYRDLARYVHVLSRKRSLASSIWSRYLVPGLTSAAVIGLGWLLTTKGRRLAAQ